MLFFIGLAIVVVGIICACIFEYSDLPGWLIGIGTLMSIIFIIIIACNYINLDGYIESMNVRHDMLVYQYENDIYENDNDLGKRELIVDIQEWNEDLARRRESQDDLWVGIFVPNIYDQFEFIELE